MLATFGLERLESRIDGNGTDDADEVAELIERAVRPARVEPARASVVDFHDEPGLPTRLCRQATANPQFQPTRHANRV
jgi:hypothetical protein